MRDLAAENRDYHESLRNLNPQDYVQPSTGSWRLRSKEHPPAHSDKHGSLNFRSEFISTPPWKRAFDLGYRTANDEFRRLVINPTTPLHFPRQQTTAHSSIEGRPYLEITASEHGVHLISKPPLPAGRAEDRLWQWDSPRRPSVASKERKRTNLRSSSRSSDLPDRRDTSPSASPSDGGRVGRVGREMSNKPQHEKSHLRFSINTPEEDGATVPFEFTFANGHDGYRIVLAKQRKWWDFRGRWKVWRLNMEKKGMKRIYWE